MKHRILKLLALLLTFGLIAAACGGDSDDGGESGASTTSARLRRRCSASRSCNDPAVKPVPMSLWIARING